MRSWRSLTWMVLAAHLAGALLVTVLHARELSHDHGRAHSTGCADCSSTPSLRAPCPSGAPCTNPHHHHHQVPARDDAAPCPRCAGAFELGPVADAARLRQVGDASDMPAGPVTRVSSRPILSPRSPRSPPARA
jgi:hypothetical protein